MNPRKQYHHEYYLAHREKIIAYQKEYYRRKIETMTPEELERWRDKQREYARLNNLAHPGYSREYYQKNKDRIRLLRKLRKEDKK